MKKSYLPKTKLGVWLVLLTLAIIGMFTWIYVGEVREALAMDPTSYNCTSDSMMRQLCEDPYGASLTWSAIFVVIFGWPLLIAWLFVATLFVCRQISLRSKQKQNR